MNAEKKKLTAAQIKREISGKISAAEKAFIAAKNPLSQFVALNNLCQIILDELDEWQAQSLESTEEFVQVQSDLLPLVEKFHEHMKTIRDQAENIQKVMLRNHQLQVPLFDFSKV